MATNRFSNRNTRTLDSWEFSLTTTNETRLPLKRKKCVFIRTADKTKTIVNRVDRSNRHSLNYVSYCRSSCYWSKNIDCIILSRTDSKIILLNCYVINWIWYSINSTLDVKKTTRVSVDFYTYNVRRTWYILCTCIIFFVYLFFVFFFSNYNAKSMDPIRVRRRKIRTAPRRKSPRPKHTLCVARIVKTSVATDRKGGGILFTFPSRFRSVSRARDSTRIFFPARVYDDIPDARGQRKHKTIKTVQIGTSHYRSVQCTDPAGHGPFGN